jgi:hypothetical protein
MLAGGGDADAANAPTPSHLLIPVADPDSFD